MRSHTDSILSISISKCQGQLVTCSSDHTIRVWDLAQRIQVRQSSLVLALSLAQLLIAPHSFSKLHEKQSQASPSSLVLHVTMGIWYQRARRSLAILLRKLYVKVCWTNLKKLLCCYSCLISDQPETCHDVSLVIQQSQSLPVDSNLELWGCSTLLQLKLSPNTSKQTSYM